VKNGIHGSLGGKKTLRQRWLATGYGDSVPSALRRIFRHFSSTNFLTRAIALALYESQIMCGKDHDRQ
jgi:hypothetical protein